MEQHLEVALKQLKQLASKGDLHIHKLKALLKDPATRDPLLMQIGLGAGAVLGVGALAYLLLSSRTKEANRKLAEGPNADVRAAATRSRQKLEFDKYEKQIMGDLVEEEDIHVDFDDIGGLDDQIKTVEELIIYPLSHPHLYSHSAVAQQPTGVLLYGPPGTGKTLLAKAIAKTANAAFLNVNVAHIQSKWFGETPKLVEAVFTLARKVSPCVVFVDEIDGVLSARNEMDQQHTNTMKTKFMECWDGLTTPAASSGGKKEKDPNKDWVLVIGATNKPWALDPAVLRRMPRQLHVGLPDATARTSILQVLLRTERAEASVDLTSIASATEGYSGSDLKELVRAAALIPIREEISVQRRATKAAAAAAKAGSAAASPVASGQPRAIATADLIAALETVKPTGVAAAQYRFAQAGAANSFAVGKGRVSSSPSKANHHNDQAAAADAGGAAASTVRSVTFDENVPLYMPSVSMRLNTQALTSAIELSTGSGGPKVLHAINVHHDDDSVVAGPASSAAAPAPVGQSAASVDSAGSGSRAGLRAADVNVASRPSRSGTASSKAAVFMSPASASLSQVV